MFYMALINGFGATTDLESLHERIDAYADEVTTMHPHFAFNSLDCAKDIDLAIV